MKLSALITTGAIASLSSLGIAAQAASALTIDFDEGLAGTPGDGTIITDQYEKDYGVTFSVEDNRSGSDYGLVLYDTECISRTIKGEKSSAKNPVTNEKFKDLCAGQDEDLATGRGRYGISDALRETLEKTGSVQKNHKRYKYDTPAQGNVLIIQENSDYSDPDDDAKGGKVTLDFNTDTNSENLSFVNGITLEMFGFVDLDEAIIRDQRLSFVFEYVDPSRDTFTIDDSNYADFITETLLSTDWKGNDLEGDNSLREYSFNNENGEFDAIKNITVEYHQISGAIAYVEYEETPVSVPEPGMLMGLGAFALGGLKLRRRKENNDGE